MRVCVRMPCVCVCVVCARACGVQALAWAHARPFACVQLMPAAVKEVSCAAPAAYVCCVAHSARHPPLPCTGLCLAPASALHPPLPFAPAVHDPLLQRGWHWVAGAPAGPAPCRASACAQQPQGCAHAGGAGGPSPQPRPARLHNQSTNFRQHTVLASTVGSLAFVLPVWSVLSHCQPRMMDSCF